VIFKVGYEVYLKLAEGTEEGDHLLDSFTNLSITKMGHYPITGVVIPLSFLLDLPERLSIYPVISRSTLKIVS